MPDACTRASVGCKRRNGIAADIRTVRALHAMQNGIQPGVRIRDLDVVSQRHRGAEKAKPLRLIVRRKAVSKPSDDDIHAPPPPGLRRPGAHVVARNGERPQRPTARKSLRYATPAPARRSANRRATSPPLVSSMQNVTIYGEQRLRQAPPPGRPRHPEAYPPEVPVRQDRLPQVPAGRDQRSAGRPGQGPHHPLQPRPLTIKGTLPRQRARRRAARQRFWSPAPAEASPSPRHGSAAGAGSSPPRPAPAAPP